MNLVDQYPRQLAAEFVTRQKELVEAAKAFYAAAVSNIETSRDILVRLSIYDERVARWLLAKERLVEIQLECLRRYGAAVSSATLWPRHLRSLMRDTMKLADLGPKRLAKEFEKRSAERTAASDAIFAAAAHGHERFLTIVDRLGKDDERVLLWQKAQERTAEIEAECARRYGATAVPYSSMWPTFLQTVKSRRA